MCRNIKTLFNFEPFATDEEIRNASLQYVRKVSGMLKVSDINETVFNSAVEEIFISTKNLLKNLETKSVPKNRDTEETKRKIRMQKIYGSRD